MKTKSHTQEELDAIEEKAYMEMLVYLKGRDNSVQEAKHRGNKRALDEYNGIKASSESRKDEVNE